MSAGYAFYLSRHKLNVMEINLSHSQFHFKRHFDLYFKLFDLYLILNARDTNIFTKTFTNC